MSYKFSKQIRPLHLQFTRQTNLLALLLTSLTLGVASLHPSSLHAQATTTSLERVTEDIKYLASDELKGRQPGTPEMKLAEAHIVAAYRAAGLKPSNKDTEQDEGYFQTFNASSARNALAVNEAATNMTLTGPDGTACLLYTSDAADE